MDSLQPLKLLLLLDDWVQPRWVVSMLEETINDGSAAICGVALNGHREEAVVNGNRLTRLVKNWRAVPYGVFQRLDRRAIEHDPFQPTDLRDLCEGVPIRTITPRRTAFSDYFPESDIAWMRSLDADVALRLGFRILRGEVLQVPRHGVWSFHHGDNRYFRGGPAGFWEVYENAPLTGAILQRLSEDLDGGEILYRTTVPTHPTSVALNRATLYLAAARGLQAALHRTRRGVQAGPPEYRFVPYGSRMYVAPGPVEALRAIAALNLRRIGRRLAGGRRKLQWHVGYRFNRLRADADGPDLSPHRLTVLPSPLGALWADPFVVSEGHRTWIFFEEVPAGSTIGRISLVEIDHKGQAGPPQPILERPHHLSYPCVFRWQDDWYMAPESYDTGKQDIYRATRFPFDWEIVRTLALGPAMVDATIFEHDSRWWMLAGRPTPGTLIGEELHAWYADNPLGEWTPHPMNPLRAGVEGTRPAGLPFKSGGRLVRPGQITAPRYGSGVMFFEIETLTPDSFSERPLGEIVPRWDRRVFGYHTVNAAGKVTVGDVLLDRRR
ncbi:hypothetical protein BH24ACI5_BH24ACI5_08870 [soil metagenome]